MRIAESASHQIFERSRRCGLITCSKFVSVFLIITKQNVIELSGSLIKLEYDIFQSNEAVTVSDGDFGGSWTMTSIETLVFQNNLKLKSSWITRRT